MKTRKVVAIFIVIACIIGCKKINIREANIEEIKARGTNIKKTDLSENNLKEKSIKETDIGKNNDKQSVLYEEIGIASFISDEYDGKMTASGVRYNRNKMTAAHPSLPFDTKILITNLRNKRKAEVVIIDRFYPSKGRILNVSHRAALELDLIESGIAKVSIKIIVGPDQNSN